jgi:hypothetical protein
MAAQTFKKKQKEQRRKEKREEKIARKLERKRQGAVPDLGEDQLAAGSEELLPVDGTERVVE